MAEGVVTTDGRPVELDAAKVDQEFARVMAAPVTDESMAPPKRPQSAPGAAESVPKPRRGRPPKAEQPRVSAAPSKATAASPELDTQRAEGVAGLAQMGAGICLVLDTRTPEENIAWRADAVTLANAAEPLSKACVEVARSNAAFAAVLDKVTKAGPYSALIAVGFQVAGQLAYNHGAAIGKMFGAMEPEKLIASLTETDSGSPPPS